MFLINGRNAKADYKIIRGTVFENKSDIIRKTVTFGYDEDEEIEKNLKIHCLNTKGQ